MMDEKIDKDGSIAIDPNMEIRTVVYKIKDLVANGLSGVISQPAVVRYFEQENPELVVKQVYSFKINHQNSTVALKIRVTKRKLAPIIALDVTINKGDGEGNHTVRIPASEEIPDDKILKPITNPARLLNAGSDFNRRGDVEIPDSTPGPIIEAADHDIIDSKNARIAELEKENAILKSAIEKFGNSDDFDWNVLARIESLETAITYAIADLPECPDSARDYLVHTQKVGEPEIEGNTNG